MVGRRREPDHEVLHGAGDLDACGAGGEVRLAGEEGAAGMPHQGAHRPLAQARPVPRVGRHPRDGGDEIGRRVRYHLEIPARPEPIEVPGFAIRALTDPILAAHLARKAEESARQVGTRLRALRKARGLTTAQVAERVGMAQQNVSRIEQGWHAVSFPTLEKILAAMGYPPEDILPAEPAESPAP
jgi:DNA-binding Xre family transcriptional regulator